ncbi:fungal Zn(2)-Cys(6) binuclear cluster domain-containing protein 25 [Elsinoe australis]|uniref:Fungal Zn(2)-Cys(6) binuclear cluster domain-containing protein 25 n=1 Tax=Elsinoe australis TaxID=40998 RepID=A0A4U7ATI2_9PEZI|nr:fungal Zn(2)-Cys(6) binuclear cluster domain-containing protein 25 [Elsinoe australis]
MVGVAGKSTGCNTCRRRKVKCDAKKPACERCTSTGRACEGYEKFAVFLNNTPTGRLKRTRLEEVRPLQTEESAKATARGSPDSGVFIQQAISPSDCSAESEANSWDWNLPIPVNTQAIATVGALGRFVEQYMPTQQVDRGMLRGHWLEIAMAQSVPGSALETSLMALAWSRAGWLLGDSNFTARSRVMYGRALSQVHQALVDPVVRKQDDVLVICRALGLYELYESTTDDTNGFHQHTMGLCKLVQMRGVGAHYSPLAKAMLMDTKWSAMIFTLTKRQGSFLASEEWDAPLEDDEYLKPDLDLVRIGLLLGASLERLDKQKRRPDSIDKDASMDEVAQEILALHQRLLDWEVNLASTTLGPLYSVVDKLTGHLIPTPLPAEPWLDSYEVIFPDLRTALLLVRKWSVQNIILTSLLSVSASVPTSLLSLRTSHLESRIHFPVHIPLQTNMQTELKNQVIHIATLITRSAPFMVDDARGWMAAQNFILPMRVATFILTAFSKDDVGLMRERDRCIAAYRGLSYGKGLGWAKVIGRVSGDDRVEGNRVVAAPGAEYGKAPIVQREGVWGCKEEDQRQETNMSRRRKVASEETQ